MGTENKKNAMSSWSLAQRVDGGATMVRNYGGNINSSTLNFSVGVIGINC